MPDQRGRYILKSGMDVADVCVACRAGEHEMCRYGFLDVLGPDRECCCEGGYDPILHNTLLTIAGSVGEREQDVAVVVAEAIEKRFNAEPPPPPAPEPKKLGDSGYIHPDAWASTADIGTLKDPNSTGHKRGTDMFPFQQGQLCDWAGQKNCGGGIYPIVGCTGHPATDLHHGPDKNTLNNARVSAGVGTQQNVHLICSRCHNTWHARNNKTYPPYDRIADQAKPWLPYVEGVAWPDQEMVPASTDELQAEWLRREEEDKRNGRKFRGRTGRDRPGRVGLIDDADDPDAGDDDDSSGDWGVLPGEEEGAS